MNKRFAFHYLMKGEPARIQATVPAHVAYWNERSLQGYLGGPFADRSGGLITFEVENLDEATQTTDNDPFVLENLVEEKWTKEWMVEGKNQGGETNLEKNEIVKFFSQANSF